MNSVSEIKYLKNKEIDYKKWDECIQQAENKNIYVQAWYLDLVAPDWDAFIFDDYKYVMPLTVGSKFGIKYLFQPTYAQQLGVFPASSEEIVKLFYSSLTRHFKYCEIQLNGQTVPVQSGNNMSFSPRKNYILPLNVNYAGLYSGYSSNTVRHLNKAIKNKLSLVSGIGLEDYLDFKSKNLWKKFKKKEWVELKRLIAFGLYKGTGKIYGVYTQENQLCAAGYFCRFDNRMIYMNGVSNEIGKKYGGMKLLIDGFIQQNAGKNIILDFEGSMVPGIARFFKGFGAYPETYFYLKFNNLPFPLKWLKQ